MKKKIIPAIIAKTQQEFEANINKVKDFVEVIQLDFMDGKFVPNSSIDFDFKLPQTKCDFEAHLMIKNPLEWAKKHYKKVQTILAHFESCDNHQEIIDFVKSRNKRVGFVLNPETDVDVLKDFINDIDQVLIMTVNPGFYGSPFLPEMLKKVTKLRQMRSDLDIEVDGGVTDKTIGLVNEAGANLFVSGSYIVKSDDVQKAVNNLESLVVI